MRFFPDVMKGVCHGSTLEMPSICSLILVCMCFLLWIVSLPKNLKFESEFSGEHTVSYHFSALGIVLRVVSNF